MRSVVLLALFVAVPAAADHYTTTYFCKRPNGVTAAQDHPCEGEQVRSVATLKHDPNLQDIFDTVAKNSRDYGRRVQCDFQRKSLKTTVDQNRLETNKATGVQQRQDAIRQRSYIAENCTPYGF